MLVHDEKLGCVLHVLRRARAHGADFVLWVLRACTTDCTPEETRRAAETLLNDWVYLVGCGLSVSRALEVLLAPTEDRGRINRR